jgi:general secretion pathway protein G
MIMTSQSDGRGVCTDAPSRLGRNARRALERGVTLVEVLIVVAIIAMVAGGAAVFALPRYRDAQVNSATTWARTIRAAVQNWQATTNETACPTMSQLVQEKHLDPGASTVDPWGQPFTLNCTEDEVYVLSMGPDKKKGTKDDIQVPKSATAESEPGN